MQLLCIICVHIIIIICIHYWGYSDMRHFPHNNNNNNDSDNMVTFIVLETNFTQQSAPGLLQSASLYPPETGDCDQRASSHVYIVYHRVGETQETTKLMKFPVITCSKTIEKGNINMFYVALTDYSLGL